jgi:hypothetical protein
MNAFRIATQSAAVAAVLILGALSVLPTLTAANGSPAPVKPIAPAQIADRGHVLSSEVDGLLASGACWAGQAPADVEIPGHVLMRVGAGDTTYSTQVDRALADVFESDDPAVTVTAFCR